jgi:hypothetical protein
LGKLLSWIRFDSSRHRVALGCGLLIAALLALACGRAQRADAIAISPSDGTPDASPYTQVSFLDVPASQIRHVSVVGSVSGRHSGRVLAYASAQGGSFLPSRPFAQGESVSVSAILGAGSSARRVRVSFGVARIAHSVGRPLPAGPPAPKSGGPPPIQSFKSQPGLQPPTLQVTARSPAASSEYVFLAPAHGPGQHGPMIVDGAGNLVWFTQAPRGTVAMNFQVQRYQGKPVLVWWQGRITSLGAGFGTNVIYSDSYQPVAHVSAGNGYLADLHDIEITPRGSAFITAYAPVKADLSSAGGPRNGALLDSVVQEVDIPTGLVMFEWHALAHVPLWDSHTTPPANASEPWDYFHVNSISLDPWGDDNFIISSRNTWAGYEISYHTGAILWRLGGRRSSFSMGPGTGMAWQHDIRWQGDRTLTIFDDGSAPAVHSQSRMIRERIDWRRRRVALLARYTHSPALLPGSQGNAQVLSTGNSFVGWGEAPYLTEFSPSGQIVFDARLPPTGQSYRAFRFPWAGRPTTPPALAVSPAGASEVALYASWNGATDLRSWRVLGGSTPSHLETLATVPASGFETTIPLQSGAAWFAVQALDGGGGVLATSTPLAR